MDKKNNNMGIIIILIIIILGLVGYIVYDKFIKNDESSKVQEPPVVNTEEEGKGNEASEPDAAINGYYRFNEVVEKDETNSEYNIYLTEELYLKDDGTFFMTRCTQSCGALEGTYDKFGDLLNLTATKSYGSDACYYSTNKDITFTIESDGNISGDNDMIDLYPNLGAKLTFTKTTFDKLENVNMYLNNMDESINCDNEGE